MASKQETFVIVDTGCANLSSVKFAIERLGFEITISDDFNIIAAADRVILPGVGNAKHAMANIKAKGLDKLLPTLTQPVLGFCLGMQLMTDSSVEGSDNHTVDCLGVIPTQVLPLASNGERLPHMGWNTLVNLSNHPIFADIAEDEYVYFVHSFAAPVSQYTIAQCQYGSYFSAAIAYKNFVGCQFHPERSGKAGSKIIKNFLTMEKSTLESFSL
ncbi:imidazole glycerol phosphate synthase subunit HisH [Thalassotalea agarivorans]|uniref:Imidazole glycerol phosphate synthase subunit HisH n=1 Tax=Thalassotalea agarivorans TaxID=349064 RepID=A0A1I0DHP9_THASX|nr:imidazole glycerol phosphate synthase subunit HisH [Thalassotalea agarivorans]SET31838.1 imidazole glycerol phosphate synthase subunit hisH [Thalassotalea agarivorans]